MKKYKRYSQKQMRYFRSMSRDPNKAVYWTNRLYSQAKRSKKKAGDIKGYQYTEKVRKSAVKYAKKGGIFKRQHWRIAETPDDILQLALTGKQSLDGTKLLILDDSNNAVLIAYEGTELYDEAIAIKKVVVGG